MLHHRLKHTSLTKQWPISRSESFMENIKYFQFFRTFNLCHFCYVDKVCFMSLFNYFIVTVREQQPL